MSKQAIQKYKRFPIALYGYSVFSVMSIIRFTIPILVVDTILRLYVENPRTLGKKNGSRYLKGGEERISTLLRSLFLRLIQMAFLQQETLGVSLSTG